MKLVDLKCPNCNHALPYKEGDRQIRCEYCNAHLIADSGDRRFRIINEAELQKVNLIKEELNLIKARERDFNETRAKRLKQRRIWLAITAGIHILFIILILSLIYINLHSGSQSVQNKLVCTLLALNFICPLILSITRPFVPKRTWDKDESGKVKLFILLLITSLAADFTAMLIATAIFAE